MLCLSTKPKVVNFDFGVTLMEETFAGRKFRGFAVICKIGESLFHEIFQSPSSAKVYSRENSDGNIFDLKRLKSKNCYPFSCMVAKHGLCTHTKLNSCAPTNASEMNLENSLERLCEQ